MPETVCLTGATGFLGSWCAKRLLESGYTVHATVRSAEKAAFLLKLPGADERLKIFPGVDLLVDGAFDEAMAGCVACMHTASPFFSSHDEAALLPPAIEGTRNVLRSCAKHGIKKVVLTSSTAAVYVFWGTKPDDHVYTSDDWSPEDLNREKRNMYGLSKLLAERLAWELKISMSMWICIRRRFRITSWMSLMNQMNHLPDERTNKKTD